MSQPQYEGTGFDPGATPTETVYLDPTQAAPLVDCQAAAAEALARRVGLENSLMVPNMSDPGMHVGPIGLDPGGVNADA